MKTNFNDEIDRLEQEQANKSLNPKAALDLYKLMGELSKECCFAGWRDGIEYSLWEILIDTATPEGMANEQNRTMYYTTFAVEQIEQLRQLSNQCQGWWMWDDNDPEWGAKFVQLENWKKGLADCQSWQQIQENGDRLYQDKFISHIFGDEK